MRNVLCLVPVVIVMLAACVAEAAFTPNVSDNNLALWVDANDSSTVRTGTITTWNNSGADALPSATYGDPVAGWIDKRTPTGSNTANTVKNNLFYNPNATTPDATRRPTYVEQGFKTSSGWKPAIRFDGINDLLITNDTNVPTLNQTFTIFIVAKSQGTSNGAADMFFSYRRYFAGDSPVELGVYQAAANDHRLRMRVVATSNIDTFNTTNNPLFDDSTLILTMRRSLDGGTYTTELSAEEILPDPWLTGTQTGTFDNTTANNKGFRLGQHVTQPLNGMVAEVLIYNSALTDTEIDDMQAYLSAKWTPEPSSGVLLALGLGLMWRRQRMQQ